MKTHVASVVSDRTKPLPYPLICIRCKKEFGRVSTPITPEAQICPECVATKEEDYHYHG